MKWWPRTDLHRQPSDSKSDALLLRYGASMDAHSGLAPDRSVLQADDSPLHPVRAYSWVDQRDLHPHSGLHRAGCCCYIMVNIGKECSREDLHLEPPPSQGGVQDYYTSGAGSIDDCRLMIGRGTMVPPRGFAPRSSAYRADALLLSYGGFNGAKWLPDVD